jgi:hypothetical protein
MMAALPRRTISFAILCAALAASSAAPAQNAPARSPGAPTAATSGADPGAPEPTSDGPIDHNKDDWYKPTKQDEAFKGRKLRPIEALSVIMDVHDFFTGQVSGSGGDVRADAALFTPSVGVFLGLTLNGGRPMIGLDFLRYIDGFHLGQVSGYDVRITLPHIELGYVAADLYDGAVMLGVGGPVGVRVTDPTLRVFADLKPEFTFYVGTRAENNVATSASGGVQLNVGYAFEVARHAKKKKAQDDDEDSGDDSDSQDDNGEQARRVGTHPERF